jgi:kelch-like protein 2/3
MRRNKLALQYVLKLKSTRTNPTHDLIFDPNYKILFDRRPKTIPPLSFRVQKHLDNMNIDLSVVASHKLPTVDPWILKLPLVLFTLHSEKKSLISPDLYKSNFYTFLSDKLNSLHIYTDGSKDDSGVAAAAVSNIAQVSCRLPSAASIFSAEARAILLALDIVDSSNFTSSYIFSDSMSCLQAISNHKFTHTDILEILEKCHALQTNGKLIQFCWIPSHVGIKGNELADNAAKTALQLPISQTLKLIYSDLKQPINAYFIETWQNQWNQTAFNKLQAIKPIIGETKLKSVTLRRDEVVLHRSRIGHTHLTHSYLLKRENAPECALCQCLLTVQHIFFDCPGYAHTRAKYFTVASLQELFSKVNLITIINYLKEIKVYDKL